MFSLSWSVISVNKCTMAAVAYILIVFTFGGQRSILERPWGVVILSLATEANLCTCFISNCSRFGGHIVDLAVLCKHLNPRQFYDGKYTQIIISGDCPTTFELTLCSKRSRCSDRAVAYSNRTVVDIFLYTTSSYII